MQKRDMESDNAALLKISRRVLLSCLMLLFVAVGKAQIVDVTNTVDTLSVKERIALRTNIVDWALLNVNFGAEFDIRKENWNRWAAGVSFFFNPGNSHTFKPGLVYNRMGVKLEFKNYWHVRTIDDDFPRHKNFFDRIFSLRRTKAGKHPTWAFYRGLYASYQDYSIKFTKTGYQGMALSLGVSYGVVRPLYIYQGGNSIDFEIGINVGAVATKNDTYELDRENNVYRHTGSKGMHFVPFPVPTELRIGLLYRFGHRDKDMRIESLVTDRYKWRWDIDDAWKTALIAKRDAEAKRRRELAEAKQFTKDSTLLVMDFDPLLNLAHTAQEDMTDTTSYNYIVLREAIKLAEAGRKEMFDMSGEEQTKFREVLMLELRYYMSRVGDETIFMDKKDKLKADKAKAKEQEDADKAKAKEDAKAAKMKAKEDAKAAKAKGKAKGKDLKDAVEGETTEPAKEETSESAKDESSESAKDESSESAKQESSESTKEEADEPAKEDSDESVKEEAEESAPSTTE